ncbi:carboxylating nicotinate-nucleotide diphosphorylase [Adhaeretor mobilis]|uniref:Probable nicotinate-nucleotide pyrophosphorylase [carboxylating] n=1 Tax=Adhaeretor mobilis TaxID=1930276 RepID=A0A517MXZ5_9BACT|nr:carboxylating nicotinate-nucleotide diphosphorylase [Adhaeretor mobilis]QDS99745.1 Nicotinate-nucleotide pyrophosphorylase [carboxylating] [Adhaeretor mobilis]
MPSDFEQLTWDDRIKDDCRALVKLAWQEDLADDGDWTTNALVPESSRGAAEIVSRESGFVCGVRAIETALATLDIELDFSPQLQDGDPCRSGTTIGLLAGSARHLLSCERILLNLMGRLSGIATLANQYVSRVEGTNARIYDTRKTTPGWRRLEKYATRCGGACNHRTGLFDAVMIKDNHLAHYQAERRSKAGEPQTAQAVESVRAFLAANAPDTTLPIEIEVDTIEQLAAVLPAAPDIILLDNMSVTQLREAVQLRDAASLAIQLEASGGVTLDTLREIAETGVDRISVGALTHSARSLDIGLDWQTAEVGA